MRFSKNKYYFVVEDLVAQILSKDFRLRNELLLRRYRKNRVEKITWLSNVSNIIQCKDTEVKFTMAGRAN